MTEDNLIYIIPPAFIVVFGTLWFVITRFLKAIAKLGPLEVREWDLGQQLFQHTFSSGTINWINFNGALTITGYQNGLLLKNLGIFGGGYHWIPRTDLHLVFENGIFGKVAKFKHRGLTFKIRGAAGKSVNREFGNEQK